MHTRIADVLIADLMLFDPQIRLSQIVYSFKQTKHTRTRTRTRRRTRTRTRNQLLLIRPAARGKDTAVPRRARLPRAVSWCSSACSVKLLRCAMGPMARVCTLIIQKRRATRAVVSVCECERLFCFVLFCLCFGLWLGGAGGALFFRWHLCIRTEGNAVLVLCWYLVFRTCLSQPRGTRGCLAPSATAGAAATSGTTSSLTGTGTSSPASYLRACAQAGCDQGL